MGIVESGSPSGIVGIETFCVFGESIKGIADTVSALSVSFMGSGDTPLCSALERCGRWCRMVDLDNMALGIPTVVVAVSPILMYGAGFSSSLSRVSALCFGSPCRFSWMM